MYVHVHEGTWLTATSHIVTAVIGSGVLSLAWAVAQLGWIAGPAILTIFSVITVFTSSLLSDCYRYPDSVHGTRNHNYREMVKNILGNFKFCGSHFSVHVFGTVLLFEFSQSNFTFSPP